MTDEGAQARRSEGEDTTQPSPATPAPSDAAAAPGEEPTAEVRPDEPTAEVPTDDRWQADPTLRDTPVGAGPATEEEPTLRDTGAGTSPPPPGGRVPPPGAGMPPPPPPPPPPGGGDPGTGAFTSRYGLVRPRQGRYVAGVCAAIARATNTDPVLWRVLLAVLGFFGGIGILVYLAAWLIIPAEGDTASPVESMLGRGRSSMSPIMVIILGILVVVMFGLIVTDGFRAVVLGAAALIGGALLLNRKPGRSASAAPGGGGVPFGAGRPWQPAAPPYPPPPGHHAQPAAYGPYMSTATFPPPPSAPPPVPPNPPVPPMQPPSPPPMSPPPPHRSGPPFPPAPPRPPGPPGPPPGGYRPPFAPHGPYAGPGPYPPSYGAPPAPPPKPPKPPKERSPLGAATFSLIFVALGLVAALDLANLVTINPSTYFFGVLVTIALGLLIGSWFGRARWLIALGFVAAAALGISTIAESQVGQYDDSGRAQYWQPVSVKAMPDRYEHNFGNAVLDLSKVDFTDQDETITVQVSFGDLEVIVPADVDTTVRAEVNAGDADIFDNKTSGFQTSPGEITDLGADGEGGGKLIITLKVNAGSAEVHR
jgi:phage shock protein PspC (stress-responsive transcriptional regulator)